LALILTPGGSEQTAALHAWCKQIADNDGASVAWMSLERYDNHLETFLSHFDRALGKVLSPQPEPSERIGLANERTPGWQDGFSNQDSLEDAVIERLNRLVDFQGELLLVLDDYHAIDSTCINEAVDLMLEYLPPQVHLVIASRSEPPLLLARLRARRQLLEVRAWTR
jgi:LuxR family maltose regulon positive regulatory protein